MGNSVALIEIFPVNYHLKGINSLPILVSILIEMANEKFLDFCLIWEVY